MQAIFKKIQGDKVLWMVVFFLSLLSLLAVYGSISSLAYKADGNSFKFLFKHSIMIIMGIGIMYVTHKMNFKYFSKLAYIMLGVAAIMLLLTLLFGVSYNDAKRWLPILGFTFQTSDFAKIALVVYLARLLTQNRTKLHSFKEGVLPMIYPVVLICGLILPADFSTAFMLAFISLLLMIIGGVPFKHIFKIVGLGIAGLSLVFMIGLSFPGTFPRIDTWINRINDFGNVEASGNFQIEAAQIAIYEGGLLPSGPGTGASRNFLPHPYSDMIYAFIIEEFGSILGGIGVLLLYLILMFRSIRISSKCPKHFGGLLALGLGLMLCTQAMINMAVTVKLIPTTGQPLPLVSLGGTSILFTCFAIGLILSVSRSVYNSDEYDAEDIRDSQANQIKDHAVA